MNTLFKQAREQGSREEIAAGFNPFEATPLIFAAWPPPLAHAG